MSKVQAVIFDCFGVLYGGSLEVFLAECPPDRRVELEDINKQSDYGLVSRQEFINSVADILNWSVEQVYTQLEQAHVRNTGLLNYVDNLRRQPGLRVGLLSNVGSDTIEQLFTSTELHRLFDTIVLSYREHIAKPHPEAFELVAERLGVNTNKCVMVDDRLDNCEGARLAGMQAVVYTSNAQTISQLNKILGLNHA